MAAVGTLTIEMAANVARLQRDMDRATRTVGGAMDKIQRSINTATKAFGLLTAAFAAYKSVQGIIQQADAMTQLNSRLQLVTKSQEDFVKTQTALIAISQRSYTSLSATVDLYAALARSTREVGVTQNDLLRVVETFNKSIIISGGSVQAAEAAITQFNQAMASGVLRGEEFNSISEQAPMIMELLSQSLGVTRGALRDMAKEGLLTAELVLPALIEGSQGVDEQFAKMSKTVGQAGQQFKNSFALLIDALNDGLEITNVFAQAIDVLRYGIEGLTKWLKISAGDLSDLIDTQSESAKFARQQAEALKGQEEAVRATAREILERKKADELAKKAAEELEKAYQTLTKRLRDDVRAGTAELQAEQQGLNSAQKEFLQLVSGPEWAQYSNAQKMIIADLFKQKIAIEQVAEAERKREKEKEENQKRLIKMIEDETEARRQFIKEDEEAEKKRLDAMEKLYEEQRKEIEKIRDQLTDALMRAFESGKGFGKAFVDTLINMFRTMVLRPILAPIVGGVTGAFGTPAIAGAMGQAASGTGFLGALTAATGALGTGLAAGFTNALSLNFAGSLTAAGQLIGTGAMSGITAGLGLAAGTLLPIVAGLSLIPSLGSALFGGKTRVTGTGITGTLSGAGSELFQFTEWSRKGGLFRSGASGTNISALPEDMAQGLQSQFSAIQLATIEMARQLGLSSNAVENFTRDIRISFTGLTQDQITQKLAEEFGKMADEMAELVLGTGATSQALQELFVRVMGERNQLEQRLLQLQGDTVELRRREMNATHESNRELLQKIFNLEDEIAANNVLAEQDRMIASMRERVAQERMSLEMRLLQAEGNTEEIRRKEIEALDESNRSILERIFNLEDERMAQAEVIRQQQEAQAIANESFSLETRLLQLQGDTVALRERELSALDQSNRGLLKQIFALEDQQAADRELAQQMAAEERQRIDLANQAARAAEEARRQQEQYIASLERAGNSIQQEILRLRGLSGIQSLSAAQSQFAILTAQARAGSAEAAAQLPELSRIISQIASETGGSRFDILRIQSQLAGSLETTLSGLQSLGARIPRYQTGGMTSGGLAIVGEAGPELVNFDRPAGIYSAQRTSNIMGGEEVALEVRALREENRQQSRAIIGLQSRMTRLLEQWDGDGLPEERVVS